MTLCSAPAIGCCSIARSSTAPARAFAAKRQSCSRRATCLAGSRAAPSSDRARSATGASSPIPPRAEMKNKLNKRVKFRQTFRPFAPIVPYERATNIFVGEDESPFMLRAKHVRPEWKDRIPAVVHVDGTARVQTVRREHNERIYDLLIEFEKLTGVPVLVNTSFNIKGEPIVETPQDAMNCFIYTGIDYLALHDTLVAKNIL